MKTPCEMIVKTVLPTIRASIAQELVENHHMSQKDAAEALGVTTAAISQYLSEKRATKRNLDPFKSKEFDKLVKEAADTIAKRPGEIEVMRAICRCCMQVRSTRLVCDMHRAIAPELGECDFCLNLNCNI